MDAPKGKNELIRTFGDIYKFIHEDGTLNSMEWENETLRFCYLPYSMFLAWKPRQEIRRIRCHHLLTHEFELVFKTIYQSRMEWACQMFGGCYSFRFKRGAKSVSTHAWGISIDVEPETNQMGTEGDLNMGIVKIFEDQGFVWGGNFSPSDPMHFQFVEGY